MSNKDHDDLNDETSTDDTEDASLVDTSNVEILSNDTEDSASVNTSNDDTSQCVSTYCQAQEAITNRIHQNNNGNPTLHSKCEDSIDTSPEDIPDTNDVLHQNHDHDSEQEYTCADKYDFEGSANDPEDLNEESQDDKYEYLHHIDYNLPDTEHTVGHNEEIFDSSTLAAEQNDSDKIPEIANENVNVPLRYRLKRSFRRHVNSLQRHRTRSRRFERDVPEIKKRQEKTEKKVNIIFHLLKKNLGNTFINSDISTIEPSNLVNGKQGASISLRQVNKPCIPTGYTRKKRKKQEVSNAKKGKQSASVNQSKMTLSVFSGTNHLLREMCLFRFYEISHWKGSAILNVWRNTPITKIQTYLGVQTKVRSMIGTLTAPSRPFPANCSLSSVFQGNPEVQHVPNTLTKNVENIDSLANITSLEDQICISNGPTDTWSNRVSRDVSHLLNQLLKEDCCENEDKIIGFSILEKTRYLFGFQTGPLTCTHIALLIKDEQNLVVDIVFNNQDWNPLLVLEIELSSKVILRNMITAPLSNSSGLVNGLGMEIFIEAIKMFLQRFQGNSHGFMRIRQRIDSKPEIVETTGKKFFVGSSYISNTEFWPRHTQFSLPLSDHFLKGDINQCHSRFEVMCPSCQNSSSRVPRIELSTKGNHKIRNRKSQKRDSRPSILTTICTSISQMNPCNSIMSVRPLHSAEMILSAQLPATMFKCLIGSAGEISIVSSNDKHIGMPSLPNVTPMKDQMYMLYPTANVPPDLILLNVSHLKVKWCVSADKNIRLLNKKIGHLINSQIACITSICVLLVKNKRRFVDTGVFNIQNGNHLHEMEIVLTSKDPYTNIIKAPFFKISGVVNGFEIFEIFNAAMKKLQTRFQGSCHGCIHLLGARINSKPKIKHPTFNSLKMYELSTKSTGEKSVSRLITQVSDKESWPLNQTVSPPVLSIYRFPDIQIEPHKKRHKGKRKHEKRSRNNKKPLLTQRNASCQEYNKLVIKSGITDHDIRHCSYTFQENEENTGGDAVLNRRRPRRAMRNLSNNGTERQFATTSNGKLISQPTSNDNDRIPTYISSTRHHIHNGLNTTEIVQNGQTSELQLFEPQTAYIQHRRDGEAKHTIPLLDRILIAHPTSNGGLTCPSGARCKSSPYNKKIKYELPMSIGIPTDGADNGDLTLYNTCCIDGFLLMIFTVLHFDPMMRVEFRKARNGMHKIFYDVWKYYQKGNFSAGKIAWCQFGEMISPGLKSVNMIGTERERIFTVFQKNRLRVESRCTNNSCELQVLETSEPNRVLTVWSFGKGLSNQIKKVITSYLKKPLGQCGSSQKYGSICQGNRLKRIKDPPRFLAINLYFANEKSGSTDIPDKVIIDDNLVYELQLVRFYLNGKNHFVDKLNVLDDWTFYDNTDGGLCYFDRDPDNSSLSSCFYVKRSEA